MFSFSTCHGWNKEAWFRSKALKHLIKLNLCLNIKCLRFTVLKHALTEVFCWIGLYSLEMLLFIGGLSKAFIISSKNAALEWFVINYNPLLWVLDLACKISEVCQKWQCMDLADARDQMSVISKEGKEEQELMNFGTFVLWFISVLKGHYLL